MATARRRSSTDNVQTFAASGKDFTNIDTWEAATDIDLDIAGQGESLECYDDADHDQDILLDGATNTSATQFRRFGAAASEVHDGTPVNGVHFFYTGTGRMWRANEDNAHIQDMVIKVTANASSARQAISLQGTGNFAIGCIVFDYTNAGNGAVTGITVGNVASSLILCLADNCQDDGMQLGTGALAYNCTSVDNDDAGIRDGGNTQILTNCLCTGNGAVGDFEGSWSGATGTSLAAEDTTAFGTDPEDSVDPDTPDLYVDDTLDNFHLESDGDAQVVGNGADLSADGTFAFNDDIDLETITTWSIGFDSIVVAAGAHLPYHPIAAYRHNLVR